MKRLIILGDGMADLPVAQLGGLTPLQAADTPYMDKLAAMGRCGMLKTVPNGFHPGSEVANLSVLGYHLPTVLEGRGVLEAASIGISIAPDEIAMRCNLVCIEGDTLKNHSAGHISSEEAKELIEHLQQQLGGDRVNFFNGVSYRHVIKVRGGSKQLDCTPPHDVPLTPYKPILIKPLVAEAEETATLLNELIEKSREVLENHPINLRRAAEGRDKANCIWPWSPGNRPQMQTLAEKYGLKSGVVISAVDLIKGIGIYAGLDLIEVEGANGLYDTNYEGKVAAALDALRTNDFVFLHIEASDEAGHEGSVELKKVTIENLENRVVKPILEEMLTWNEPITIALLPDHPTPCVVRTHTADPVPFVIYCTDNIPDSVTRFDEFAAQSGVFGQIEGDTFMKLFMN